MRHFIAAAETGSFSAAARQLGRAQSAVSTAIGLLEADLGVELFDRSKRSPVLTEAGEVLLLEAQQLLRQAAHLQQRALSFSAGEQARLVLAVDEALPDLVMDAMLNELSRRFPALELTLLSGTAAEVAAYVESGRAAMGIHFDRAELPATLVYRHLGSVRQGIYVSHRHPLAAQTDISTQDLARHRQLVMHMEDRVDMILSPYIWRADSFYNIAAMVADNLGWAILPLNIAEYHGYRSHLVQAPCRDLSLPPAGLRALWRQGSVPGPVAVWAQRRVEELLHPD
ncbi:LysR-family transcriptional regulator [Bordetella avium 197N]|uniref:LysR-family transcriptional regulator n=2 Tax=Bordetella avium TaxID=521 RepID=Q2L0X0_BORA1|nr:LysR-family transcriptional regulator [Bordetella avium 197N]